MSEIAHATIQGIEIARIAQVHEIERDISTLGGHAAPQTRAKVEILASHPIVDRATEAVARIRTRILFQDQN